MLINKENLRSDNTLNYNTLAWILTYCVIACVVLLFFNLASPFIQVGLLNAAEYLQNASETSNARPNIVFILADDLGYGDLGCYGQKKIKTPEIDKLADAGIKFTRHYAGNNVCAPSRCVLMTGLHPGHAYIRDNKEIQPEGQFPIPIGPDSVTLVSELKKRGYKVGGFGKWGLGAPGTESAPLKFGFDRFYGYNCQRQAHTYYPEYLWDNDEKVVINKVAAPAHAKLKPEDDPNDPAVYERFVGENYSPDMISEQALRFVKEHKHEPFFLYYPTTVPHLALQVPNDSLEEYKDIWDEMPYTGDRGYTPHLTPRAAYAAMVTRLDNHIGKLIALLKQEGIYDNTIIVFTSDNGPLYDKLGGTDDVFFNSGAGFRGRKGSMYEGGLVVPCVVTWGNKITSGSVTDRVTGFEDWLPTLLELSDSTQGVNITQEGRTNLSELASKVDGVSFAKMLLGVDQPDRNFLYRESPGYGGQQMVISGDYKAVRTALAKAKQEGKTLEDYRTELYDLKNDPYETRNISDNQPEILKRLEAIMQAEHEPSRVFPLPLVD
ncbi:MAG: arylsulfatase [Thermoguttaceae bacterium]